MQNMDFGGIQQGAGRDQNDGGQGSAVMSPMVSGALPRITKPKLEDEEA